MTEQKFLNMTESQLDAEAERLTIKRYLSGGRFGGFTKKGGVKTYFDFQGNKQAILKELREKS